MMTKNKEKNFDKLKDDHLKEVRKTANQFSEELEEKYVPLKEQIAKLKAQLEAMEWKARYFE
jgi:hypothetical protein